jgi:hypothetical protein
MFVSLLLWLIVFIVLVYVVWWICEKFQAPRPVFWLVGLLLLIIVLVKIADLAGIRLP